MENNYQKIKLLRIMEILRQDTDEHNQMTKAELCERLREYEITCDPRTLGKDIKLLNDQGFEVMCSFDGHERCYYIEDRSFSVPEIKILIDAVQASKFITEKKTNELIEKLAALGGSHRAEVLQNNIIYVNTRKHTNESIYYNVDIIDGAIYYNKKVKFKYFDINEEKQKVYRKNGEFYKVEPISLVYNEDNYYLVAYDPSSDLVRNYRIDRMNSVERVAEFVSKKVKEMRKGISDVAASEFKMFSGELRDVTLRFDSSILGAVYDKFGEDIKVEKFGRSKLATTVKVQVAPPFFGWVFQFGKLMSITEPDDLINQFNEMRKGTKMKIVGK